MSDISWNYRILRLNIPFSDDIYVMKEIYYNEDGTPRGSCDADVLGDSVEDIRNVLGMMLEACDKEVISGADFGE